MKRIRYIWLLMIVMMLTSCELFNFEELSTESPNKVKNFSGVALAAGADGPVERSS